MALEDLIVPALRRESVPWPTDASGRLEDAVLQAAAEHGVSALLSTTPAAVSWPDRVRRTLSSACRTEAALEAVQRVALIELLAELAKAGVPALVLKGAQVAYTHYLKPWHRPRLDTDLLISPDDRVGADEVLRGLGYRPGTHFGGNLVTHQFQYERIGRHGVPDVVDLHWRIANPHIFAAALTFDELERDATAIDPLGANARGLCTAHALVLACIHRVAHHNNSDRLIWLYDIHLLASSMSAETRDGVAELARTKRLRAVCARGVEHAHQRFGTPLSHGWTDGFDGECRASEPTASFLVGRSKTDVLLSDLRTLDGWRPRLNLLREHLFPPVDYVKHAYGVKNPAFIALAYAQRVVGGVGKWFQRSNPAS